MRDRRWREARAPGSPGAADLASPRGARRSSQAAARGTGRVVTFRQCVGGTTGGVQWRDRKQICLVQPACFLIAGRAAAASSASWRRPSAASAVQRLLAVGVQGGTGADVAGGRRTQTGRPWGRHSQARYTDSSASCSAESFSDRKGSSCVEGRGSRGRKMGWTPRRRSLSELDSKRASRPQRRVRLRVRSLRADRRLANNIGRFWEAYFRKAGADLHRAVRPRAPALAATTSCVRIIAPEARRPGWPDRGELVRDA